MIFISYRNIDLYKRFKDRFLEVFKAKCNLNKETRHYYDHLWSDYKLEGGDNWKEEIVSKVEECKIFIFLAGIEAFASDVIMTDEIEAAIDRYKKDKNSVRIFWLCINGKEGCFDKFEGIHCSNVIKKAGQISDDLNSFKSLEELFFKPEDKLKVDEILQNLAREVLKFLQEKNLFKHIQSKHANYKDKFYKIDRLREITHIDQISRNLYEESIKFQNYYWFCNENDDIENFKESILKGSCCTGATKPRVINVDFNKYNLKKSNDCKYMRTKWVFDLKEHLHFEIEDPNPHQKLSLKQMVENVNSSILVVNHLVYATFLKYHKDVFEEFVEWIKTEFSNENDGIKKIRIIFLFSIINNDSEVNLKDLENYLDKIKTEECDFVCNNLQKMDSPSLVKPLDLKNWLSEIQFPNPTLLEDHIKIPVEGIFLKTLKSSLKSYLNPYYNK